MRSVHYGSTFVLALVLAAGGACSSSSGSPRDAASTGGTGGSAGAGGSGGAAGSDGGGQASDGPALTDGLAPDSSMTMSLTSSALAAGATFMVANTCAGVDTSPPLSWTAGPTGTMSYAVALIDLDYMEAVHWVIWDIPSGTTSLDAALPAAATFTTAPIGAKQAHKTDFFGSTDAAYHGPCPSGATHHYLFQVNALNVATLPSPPTDTGAIEALVAQHSIAHGDLIGLSNASKPTDAGGQ